ncbi:MAG: hypothetical protein AB8B91_01960 [Rubripirellula sp.]
MKSQHSASMSTSGPRFQRFSLSLMVCIWLLQIPVPVMHQHEHFASDLRLSEHVNRHHSAQSGCCLEWHWHFVPPSEMGHDQETSDDIPKSVATFASVSGQVTSGSTESALDRYVRQASELSGLDDFASIPSSIFQERRRPPNGLRPTVRACALLCVMQV